MEGESREKIAVDDNKIIKLQCLLDWTLLLFYVTLVYFIVCYAFFSPLRCSLYLLFLLLLRRWWFLHKSRPIGMQLLFMFDLWSSFFFIAKNPHTLFYHKFSGVEYSVNINSLWRYWPCYQIYAYQNTIWKMNIFPTTKQQKFAGEFFSR